MKVIINRIWHEPAVFIGLVTTLGLLVLNILGGDNWTVETFVEVLAPLVSSLGIRQLVTPARSELE